MIRRVVVAAPLALALVTGGGLAITAAPVTSGAVTCPTGTTSVYGWCWPTSSSNTGNVTGANGANGTHGGSGTNGASVSTYCAHPTGSYACNATGGNGGNGG
jgi:hypothetical protein